MDAGRRNALRSGGGLTLAALLGAAGWLEPDRAFAQAAWNKAAFDTHDLRDTTKALGGCGG